MKRDAATAFKAIISARKASAEGCWQSVKENFTCHTAAGVLFALVALTEVFTNTMIIIFDVVKDKTTCYMVLVLAVPPRVAVFVWASWSLSKKNWWRYWITIDNVLLLTTVISIIYGYMLLKVPAATEHLAGDLGWRIAAVVSLPTIMSAFNGNFRILVKMYPWTPATIFIYKVLRIYAVITGTITQLNLRTKNVDGMDPGLLILYVSSQVSYHVSLLSRIPSWTAWQRSMEAKAKAAKEAGVNLTLDSASQSPKIFSALANNDALGYTSFDEENEESIQFFQNSGNDPAVSLQLGTNDDAAIPVDLSNMKSLQQDTHAILSGDEESDADGYL